MLRSYITGACILISILHITSATPLTSRRNVAVLTTSTRDLEDYTLPTDIVPLNYDIQLIPYLDFPAEKNFTFDGEVTIEVVVIRPTKMIRLHANDININEIIVSNEDGDSLNITDFTLTEDDRHFLTIDFDNTLPLGDLFIYIKYTGKLNDALEGFYRSSYQEEGKTKWMAVTQFESTGARRAFPCFDEPVWKATFKLKIAHAPEHTVLSNMPDAGETVVDDPLLPNWTLTHFKETVVMSTYLVAFTVSEFESLKHPERAEFQDWARPSLVQYAVESNAMAPLVIDHMTHFTGIEYKLPKMAQIAIPDFAAGAMENWGLVAYRESLLLYIPNESTTADLIGLKSTVAHELAHQWFGNLVTLKWWDSLWLNEGFATFFSYHVLNAVYPEWSPWTMFVKDEMHVVFQIDGLESTHALLVYADNPVSTRTVADSISYNKGACMVHMIRNFMGDDAFQSGIIAYLKASEYNTVDKDDLWDGLQTAVPPNLLPEQIDVKTIMDTWVVQPGYPVVTVRRDYSDKTISINQERFLTLRTGETNEVWWIPLTMTSQDAPDFNDTNVKAWHNGTKLELSVTASKSHWVILNVNQAGYYRVNYDAENWALISKAKSNVEEMEKISEINRAQIMDDALALARASLLDYNVAMETTDYLDLETEYMPWNAALFGLSYIYDRLAYQKDSRELQEQYVLEKMAHMYELVEGFTITEGESVDMKRTRSLVLSWYCKLNNDTCNNEAATMFDTWQATPETNLINPDLKSVVYCSAMKKGNVTEYEFLISQYDAMEEKPAERSLILSALGCATDTTLLQLYLDESIKEGSKIRSQDSRKVLAAVYNNYIGVDIALDFLLTNYETLKEAYGGLGAVQSEFTEISVKLNTKQQREKIEDFLDSHESLESSMITTLESVLKTVDETLAWHDNHRGIVLGYYRKKLDNSANVMQISPILMLCVTFIYLFSSTTEL